jgi:hypothetical protein
MYVNSLEDIRNELYSELKAWEKRMLEKLQHDVVAMREIIDVRIERIREKEGKR